MSKSTQSTIFRDTLYFTCDLWLTKIDSKSKRFFWFKVHSSYHPRINSACLVFQTQPAEQLALSWCSGKAHQCHLCRCTLITQHFHFSLANLILRLTHVFKIFAEKYFQSIKIYRNLPDLKFISYLQNLYFEFLVLLSNLEKMKSLSLYLLESGESFKKILFLLSNLEKWNPFLFLFSKLENIFSNFSFSSRLDFFASRSSVGGCS